MTTATIPGYIWIDGPVGTLGEGRREAVPTACPKCGRDAVRKGNRHHREVYCVGWHDYPWNCDWRQTVYYGEPTS